MARSSSCRRSGVEEASCRSLAERIAALHVPLTLLLETAESPAALWSADRSASICNPAALHLFGAENDPPLRDRASWCARIDASDRTRFLEFCEAVQARGGRSRCLYRFAPPGGEEALELVETARALEPAPGVRVIFSRYAAEAACRRAAHKIGNHLQAVHGELDLLRLSGALPESAAMSVLRPLDAVHALLREIGKPHS